MSFHYAQKTAQLVPGLEHLHVMAGLLLAEKMPADGRLLVLGAGGGMELKKFASMQPRWSFTGVDPSAEMLELARQTLGGVVSRVDFHQGYIDSAPLEPYDAATCLLTLHFLPEEERRKTVREVYRRLKPGAPFVVAHHSFPTSEAEKDKWLARYAAFAVASGVPAAQFESGLQTMKERLPVLSPEEDVAVLRDAGFAPVEAFYAAFTFKGWVAYRTETAG